MTASKPTPKKSAGEWRPAFLQALRNSGNVRAACQAAGIDRKTAYQHRDKYPDFAAAWQDALDEAIDALEAVARKRALETSDTLMIFLLKAHRPALYRETHRTLNITVTPEALAQLSDAELADLEQRLSAR